MKRYVSSSEEEEDQFYSSLDEDTVDASDSSEELMLSAHQSTLQNKKLRRLRRIFLNKKTPKKTPATTRKQPYTSSTNHKKHMSAKDMIDLPIDSHIHTLYTDLQTLAMEHDSRVLQVQGMLDQAIDELKFLKKQEEQQLQSRLRRIRECFETRLEIVEQQYLSKVQDIYQELEATLQAERDKSLQTLVDATDYLQQQTKQMFQLPTTKEEEDKDMTRPMSFLAYRRATTSTTNTTTGSSSPVEAIPMNDTTGIEEMSPLPSVLPVMISKSRRMTTFASPPLITEQQQSIQQQQRRRYTVATRRPTTNVSSSHEPKVYGNDESYMDKKQQGQEQQAQEQQGQEQQMENLSPVSKQRQKLKVLEEKLANFSTNAIERVARKSMANITITVPTSNFDGRTSRIMDPTTFTSSSTSSFSSPTSSIAKVLLSRQNQNQNQQQSSIQEEEEEGQEQEDDGYDRKRSSIRVSRRFTIDPNEWRPAPGQRASSVRFRSSSILRKNGRQTDKEEEKDEDVFKNHRQSTQRERKSLIKEQEEEDTSNLLYLRPEEAKELRSLRNSISLAKDWMQNAHTGGFPI